MYLTTAFSWAACGQRVGRQEKGNVDGEALIFLAESSSLIGASQKVCATNRKWAEEIFVEGEGDFTLEMNSTATPRARSYLHYCLDFQLWPDGPGFLQTLVVYQTTLVTYLGLPVSLVGIATSVTSVVLFSRDYLTPRTTRRLLLTMSVVDIAFLIASLLYLQIMKICGRSCRQIAYLLPVSTLVNVLEMLRNWTVVLICLERYIITCYPLQAKRWLRLPTVNASIALCLALTVTARLSFMAYVTVESYGTSFVDIVHLLKQIHSTTDAVLVTLLPLLILMWCSFRICRCIHFSEVLRQKVTSLAAASSCATSKGRRSALNSTKVTRVLLVVILVFGVLMLPLIPVTVFAFEWFPPAASCGVLIAGQIVDPIAVLGSLLHSMANFVIYVVCWPKYRRILLQMCISKHRDRRDVRRGSTSYSNDAHLLRSLVYT